MFPNSLHEFGSGYFTLPTTGFSKQTSGTSNRAINGSITSNSSWSTQAAAGSSSLTGLHPVYMTEDQIRKLSELNISFHRPAHSYVPETSNRLSVWTPPVLQNTTQSPASQYPYMGLHDPSPMSKFEPRRQQSCTATHNIQPSSAGLYIPSSSAGHYNLQPTPVMPLYTQRIPTNYNVQPKWDPMSSTGSVVIPSVPIPPVDPLQALNACVDSLPKPASALDQLRAPKGWLDQQKWPQGSAPPLRPTVAPVSVPPATSNPPKAPIKYVVVPPPPPPKVSMGEPKRSPAIPAATSNKSSEQLVNRVESAVKANTKEQAATRRQTTGGDQVEQTEIHDAANNYVIIPEVSVVNKKQMIRCDASISDDEWSICNSEDVVPLSQTSHEAGAKSATARCSAVSSPGDAAFESANTSKSQMPEWSDDTDNKQDPLEHERNRLSLEILKVQLELVREQLRAQKLANEELEMKLNLA